MEMIKTLLEKEIVKVSIGADLEPETNALVGNVELDIESQAHFVEFMNSIFEEGSVKVIVDMHLVSYIDSSGLWALFEGHKKAAQKNGVLVLLNTTKDVKRVLDITKMSSKIQAFHTEDEALNSLRK